MSITPPPPMFDPSVQGQQQPPPVTMAPEQAFSGHGSAGPVIAVLALITILGAIAVIIGRICFGRAIFGHGRRYDLEGWVESKCASCVGGRVDSPAPRQVVGESSNNSRSGEAMPPPPAAAARVEILDQDTNEQDEEEIVSDQANNNNPGPNDPGHRLAT